jgi:hypothetical protein
MSGAQGADISGDICRCPGDCLVRSCPVCMHVGFHFQPLGHDCSVALNPREAAASVGGAYPAEAEVGFAAIKCTCSKRGRHRT